jgi:hypothetical protein
MKVSAFIAASALALSGVALGAAPASAHSMSSHECSGTFTSPGLLAGTYSGDVEVDGYCQVNGGAAVVKGNLTLAPGSALNATFALNDVTGHGRSSLTVYGNVKVLEGATLAMGCEAEHSPCSDDPNAATGGTLTGQNRVYGNLTGRAALAIIVHAAKIGGNVDQEGGGGGEAAMTCQVPTSGVFSVIGSPVFSDYEDNWISGNLTVSDLRTCWFGALRDHVSGNVRDSDNKFGDPDANEVDSNVVRGNLNCYGNSPAVQFGDAAGGTPNKVSGNATGECGFDVLLHNPTPNGPLTPISVRA